MSVPPFEFPLDLDLLLALQSSLKSFEIEVDHGRDVSRQELRYEKPAYDGQYKDIRASAGTDCSNLLHRYHRRCVNVDC
jgi:hypothetical protein